MPAETVGGPEPELRVVLLSSTFPASPTDPVPRFVLDLILAVSRRDPGIRFTVIAPHTPGASAAGLIHHELYDEHRFRYAWPERWEQLAGAGGILARVSSSPILALLIPSFLVAQWIALRRVARSVRPHVVNPHWIVPQGLVVAVSRRLPGRPRVVLTAHGSDVFALNAPALRRLKRWILDRADTVTVNSSATRAEVERIAPGATVLTIPMGVDLDAVRVERRPRDELLRVLFVGRLSGQKGVDDLVRAAEILRDAGRSVAVRVVGDGPERAALERAAQQSGLGGTIAFAGWVDRSELAAQFEWADVLVGPSRTTASGAREALGVVFLEASAASLPVIATRVGGIPDAVVDGETGILVPPDDPVAIAAAIARIDDDRLSAIAMGARGRAYVAASFSWAAVAARFASALRESGARR